MPWRVLSRTSPTKESRGIEACAPLLLNPVLYRAIEKGQLEFRSDDARSRTGRNWLPAHRLRSAWISAGPDALPYGLVISRGGRASLTSEQQPLSAVEFLVRPGS